MFPDAKSIVQQNKWIKQMESKLLLCEVIYEIFHILNCGFEIK